ncbi:MAG: hypothetical protein M0Q49_11420 [Porticoccaceae bacterium]|nr:hypothetical protein [Porticoccaceae bacterium]
MQFGNRITLHDKEAARLPGGRCNPVYLAQFVGAAVQNTQNTIKDWVSKDSEKKLIRPTLMISCDPKGIVINLECEEATVFAASTWFAVQYNPTAFNQNYRSALTAVAERWAREDYSQTFVVTEGGVQTIASVL